MAVLIPAFANVGTPLRANPAGPSGADILAGNVSVSGLGTSTVDINNFSQHAIINWESFSIQQGELTRINQGVNAATLNRVNAGNPSEIYGRLEASNGSVFLLNPNGILVGAGGVVDVAGMLTMSTLDVNDADFRNGGDTRFYGGTNSGVSNFGTISSAAGDVVLLGGFVHNKGEGQIGALNGTVAIGSGGDIILHEGGGNRISVRGSSDYTGTGIDNEGTVSGASVEMKTHGNVYALAINNGNAIRATGADRSGGKVRLMASGGSSNINLGQNSTIYATSGSAGGSVDVQAAGEVAIGGTVNASGLEEGGSVSVVGNSVTQAAGSAIVATGSTEGGSISLDAAETMAISGVIDAGSAQGAGGEIAVTAKSIVINDGADLAADGASGGRIRVGGDFQGEDTGLREADSVRVNAGAVLSADSNVGDAGTVIVWANQDTIFVGEVSAKARGAVGNGGLVEVSGKEYLHFDGSVAVNASGGKNGVVLFDPGNVVIGASGPPTITYPGSATPPTSLVSISSVNDALQSGANVLIVTESGSIFFNPVAGGGAELNAVGNSRDAAVQWTNSLSSFGAFASGDIVVNNHIRTSGAGSINLLAGWTGIETETEVNTLSPQAAWDHYMSIGAFGANEGSVFVGSSSMFQHVEVGSRFGDTNVAGYDVSVTGSSTDATLRYAQIGFHDGGQAFAPRVNLGGGVTLDLREGNGGVWYLSDGRNSANAALNQEVAGVGDPVVAIVGKFEVDINGDGVADGVYGINSSGVLTDTFIPYASHYNSAATGNWWWQQIEARATAEDVPNLVAATAGSSETFDPLGLGGLRPEYGAGVGSLSTVALATASAAAAINGVTLDSADINVFAKNDVFVTGGAGRDSTGAMIGHGGTNVIDSNGTGNSIRDIGAAATRDVSNSSFSLNGVERNQIERRWSFNGSTDDLSATSIGRLAPVYGNINVMAGVDAGGVIVDRSTGIVTASVANTGDVSLVANQNYKTANPSTDSAVQIGHGGAGQFGEYYGDIRVEAGGDVTLLAGEGTRSYASIGHTVGSSSYWNPPGNSDQQLRFFATIGDFDNPNLRRGELFSGMVTTGFDPTIDPAKDYRISLAKYNIVEVPGENPGDPSTFVVELLPDNQGNYIPVIDPATGDPVISGTTGFAQFINRITGEIIDFNPAQYTLGTSGGGNNAAQGGVRQSLAPLYLAPVSQVDITVAALDGSIISGFHGNVSVVAKTGSVTLQAGVTDTVRNAAGNIINTERDSRFATIGHGGVGSASNDIGAGYQGSGTANPTAPGIDANGMVTGNIDGRESVAYRVAAGDGDTSGSESIVGPAGSETNRSNTLMSITGDVSLISGQDISMIAGNDLNDYTKIGHGGVNLADAETSSFILGDIFVQAGGNLDVIGGGAIQPVNRGNPTATNGENNYNLNAWSQIGHGGILAGFMGYMGDISVDVVGDIHIQNGAHTYTFAKIGHQGVVDQAQSGGSFARDENFRYDGVQSDVVSSLLAGSATVTYTADNGHASSVVGVRDFSASGAGTSVGIDRNTADISVRAGGSITLDHMVMGERQPLGRFDWLNALPTDSTVNPDNQGLGVRTRDSYAQIGHGGIATDSRAEANTAANYGDKVGNITVMAEGGSVILENGEGEQRWTRIGHGVGEGDRVTGTNTTGDSRSIELAGNIIVTATGDIRVDAAAADDDESGPDPDNRTPGNNGSLFGSTPSRWNPVVIGHGGISNNLDLVVLGNGEDVNGILASSDITVDAGMDLFVLGGNGNEASFAQIGHGFTSDLGNDAARRLNVPTGFTGDIDVRVGNNLLVQAGSNAWTTTPNSSDDETGVSVSGALAVIGHGGYQLDAPSSGDITVYVGNNAQILGQVRDDEATTRVDLVSALYSYVNSAPGSGALSSVYNFAKIGHFSVENGNRNTANNGDAVGNAAQDGDITVVVWGDLSLKGGTLDVDPFDPDLNPPEVLSNIDTHTIYGAFAQIGHGGPGIAGNVSGDITVLVKGNISVEDGVNNGVDGVDSIAGSLAVNNYAMIGNGDFVKDTNPASTANIFRREGQGTRTGDIVVAAGLNALFSGVLVGHADPMTSTQLTIGNTQIAVSRLAPFYGGTGTLTATNGTVFSSGGFGNGSRLEFYVPSRSNNFVDDTTRLNEGTETFVAPPGDFQDEPGVGGKPFIPENEEVAGRADEVYLTPDLWWDELGLAAAAGFPGGGLFPTAAVSGDQGGAIALVGPPGGIPNFITLVNGALGTSADLYRDNNAVSGTGHFTFYYDATEIVGNVFPLPPPPPFPGPYPNDLYDSFWRGGGFLDNEYTGENTYLSSDENGDGSNGIWSIEDRLDQNFGMRRGPTTEEEEDEERKSLEKKRAQKVGPLGLAYYVYDPATNKYSSYRVFGQQSSDFSPSNYSPSN